MTSTSVEHPPTVTPILQTVPFHSHVFIAPFSTRSPLVPLMLRFLLNVRVSIDSPGELEGTTASGVGVSRFDCGIVPEGKDLNMPLLLVVSFQTNISWIETPTCRCRETWSVGSSSFRSKCPAGTTSWKKNGISSVTQKAETEGMNNWTCQANASIRLY